MIETASRRRRVGSGASLGGERGGGFNFGDRRPMLPLRLTKEQQAAHPSGGLLDVPGNRGFLEDPVGAPTETLVAFPSPPHIVPGLVGALAAGGLAAGIALGIRMGGFGGMQFRASTFQPGSVLLRP